LVEAEQVTEHSWKLHHVVWHLDLLGAHFPYLRQTVEDLVARGVGLKSLVEAIGTPMANSSFCLRALTECKGKLRSRTAPPGFLE